MKNNYFIAIYTYGGKSYCEDMFFKRIKEIAQGNPVHIVDNSSDLHYYNKLKSRYSFDNFTYYHLNITEGRYQFLRTVEKSANYLRKLFLKTNLPKFLIIESDVIPPVDLLDRFDNTLSKLPEDAGILGALYYKNFHDFSKKGIQKVGHALSGCTVYKRKLIEKYSFRWSVENLAAFPDAWICGDCTHDFTIWNNNDIICKHMNYM